MAKMPPKGPSLKTVALGNKFPCRFWQGQKHPVHSSRSHWEGNIWAELEGGEKVLHRKLQASSVHVAWKCRGQSVLSNLSFHCAPSIARSALYPHLPVLYPASILTPQEYLACLIHLAKCFSSPFISVVTSQGNPTDCQPFSSLWSFQHCLSWAFCLPRVLQLCLVYLLDRSWAYRGQSPWLARDWISRLWKIIDGISLKKN
jgi:hypothetical protein